MPSDIEPSTIDFTEYQIASSQTAIYPVIGGGEIYPALGLANEAGELLGKIKKVYRDREGKYSEETLEGISAELGDVLWYCAQLATELGLSLEKAAASNLQKLRSRQERNALTGDGDNR